MTLFVVATPIGNLKDITLRALEVLKEVDYIVAEDTRVTKKLLSRYEINKKVLSFHEHSSKSHSFKILRLLKDGSKIAYVVDAGTPAVSDPGSYLVRQVTRELPDAKIIPIPGPSALIAAVSISGISTDKFLFLGFPPVKKGRRKFMNEVNEAKYPVIIYESPHRIKKTISELCDIGLSMFDAILIKEISKVYEKTLRMSMAEMAINLENDNKVMGEFVLVINKDIN
jgi:16S rRNA (cytidine1402-2'-O)-methyltransferase